MEKGEKPAERKLKKSPQTGVGTLGETNMPTSTLSS